MKDKITSHVSSPRCAVIEIAATQNNIKTQKLRLVFKTQQERKKRRGVQKFKLTKEEGEEEKIKREGVRKST